MGKHYKPKTRRKRKWPYLLLIFPVLGVALFLYQDRTPGPDVAAGPRSRKAAVLSSSPSYWSDPDAVGRPWQVSRKGLLTFRGNPTRSWYGAGPVPSNPRVLWQYPKQRMCSSSTSGGETKQWCGTGWTGQPSVFDYKGTTWVVFGAYDRAVHFVNADTGQDILPPFPTGDIIKGSVTVDPDGYPIVYSGSRDGYFHAIAIDGNKPRELWKLSAHAVSPTLWNDDWDPSALVIDDYLFEGGENSQFHIVKLNRGYNDQGKVTVDPKLVFNMPGWDEQLLKDIGDKDVSIENSVAIYKDTLYFANSGGLVQGWDISGIKKGRAPERVFRFWTGDDTDASIAIDKDGYLYVASEYERHTARSLEVGQIMKLDPSSREKPLVWSVSDHDAAIAGSWTSLAISNGIVYGATNGGRLLAIDQKTGDIVWQKLLPGPTWQSPVAVDKTLVMGDCGGTLHAYDVSDPRQNPPELWGIKIGACIESTPAVWKGRIYVGTRLGFTVALGN